MDHRLVLIKLAFCYLILPQPPSVAYLHLDPHPELTVRDRGLVPPFCPDSLLSTFHSTCSEILESVAPFRRKSTKTKTDPWLSDHTCLLRQQCRQAGWQWKKDRLHVSLGWLRDSLAAYQRALKEAKSKYLSSTIANSSHHPRLLFNTIDCY